MHPANTNNMYSLLSPSELSLAPMDDCHKYLVQRHYTRLLNTISQPNDLLIGNYTSKQAAREQLARMTLIIRDYILHAKVCRERGKLEEYDEHVESMIIDVVEAALTVNGQCKAWSQPLFVNGRLWGREQEIASIMQEYSTEGVHDVIELWQFVPASGKDQPLPDTHAREDIGKEIDWNRVLLRSRSESDILHVRKEFEIEDREKWRENLMTRELEELDLDWPAVFKDPEPNAGRQRGRRMTGPNSCLDPVQTSRAGSRAGRVSRGITGVLERPSLSFLKELQEQGLHAGNDSAVGSPELSPNECLTPAAHGAPAGVGYAVLGFEPETQAEELI